MRCLVAITLLLHMGSALAESVIPRIWHFNNSVQVDVWNTTDADIDCSGSVRIQAQSGRTQYESYWETIYRGMSRTRTYRLHDFNDRVVSASHSIYCRER